MSKQALIMAVLEEKTDNLLSAGYIEQMFFIRDCLQIYSGLQGGMLETNIVEKIVEITQDNWNEYLNSCLKTFRENNVGKNALKKCKTYIENVAKQRKFSNIPNEIENKLHIKLSETSQIRLKVLYENIEINTVKKLNEYIPATIFSKENLKSWTIAIIQNLLASLIWSVVALGFGIIIGKRL
ncbi:MAG: hypothetical protein AB9836_07830 [Aminipila sp.]